MKNKGLFDHIKQITNVQNPMYWDTLTESDKKTWSNYMIHRFISMKSDWIEVENEIQRYWRMVARSYNGVYYCRCSNFTFFWTRS